MTAKSQKTKTESKIPTIGVLALKNLLITKEELKQAMRECSGAPCMSSAMKEYLLANELVSTKNITRLLRAVKALATRKKEFQFGAIAIKKGYINKSVLKLVLDEQAKVIKKRKKLVLIGDLLVEAGMLSAKQRDHILKLQKRVIRDTVREIEQEERKESKEAQSAVSSDPEQVESVKEQTSGKGKDKSKAVESEQAVADKAENDEQEPEKTDEPDEAGLLDEPIIIDGGIKLEIARDFMSAFITKTDYFNQDITVEELKESLFVQGIVLGLEEDKTIEGFINSSGFKTKAFKIAQGITPIEGKDARIEFFFNTDYLKVGGVTEDGTIDFKDRGKVPHVEEGTVLAEKIPMIESRDGRNIYGEETPANPGRDIALKLGKGARLSEDGFKIIAAVKGFPKYTLAGQIFVHQEYCTDGDVDYQTGHINYDGNVIIKGRIKSGFKVKSNDATAGAIDGGSIDADGNVNIIGGINEGRIYARGSVYANFIHDSEIICMGDVVVQKEIVGSEIKCSGSCRSETGKLISSTVSAKMGVNIKNIGTQATDPNHIQVAMDAFFESELETNTSETDALMSRFEDLQASKDQLMQESAQLQQRITDLAHIQDRSQTEQRDVHSRLAALEKDQGSKDEITDLKKQVEQLQQAAHGAEKDLDTCFDASDQVEVKIGELDRSINNLEIRLEMLKTEKRNLSEWSSENPGKAEVIVTGVVSSGTIIRGKHCEKRIDESTRHVRFTEAKTKSESGELLNIYEIQAGNI